MAIYTAVFNQVAVTAQQDLFEIVSPADAITIIHGLELSQSTELGDAAEEMLTVLIRRGQTTSGSGGTAVTANPIETGSSAYGGTVEANNTTRATTGTILTLRADNWNVRMPYLWLPTPEMRPINGPSSRMTFELASTPADAITMSGTLWFEELGG